MSPSSVFGAFITFSKYKALVIPLSSMRALCSGCSKSVSKNSFGGSLSPLVPLSLELYVDDEAANVAVSVFISSASLCDPSDVSPVCVIISKVMVLRYTCSVSSIPPSEDRDSLCSDLRFFFFETVFSRFSLRFLSSLREALGRLLAFLRDHFSKSALQGGSVFLLRLSFLDGFRVGEREWLLPTGDRERSLSLGSSVLLLWLLELLCPWPLVIGLSDRERLLLRSCFVGLLFLSSARFRRYDFRWLALTSRSLSDELSSESDAVSSQMPSSDSESELRSLDFEGFLR